MLEDQFRSLLLTSEEMASWRLMEAMGLTEEEAVELEAELLSTCSRLSIRTAIPCKVSTGGVTLIFQEA